MKSIIEKIPKPILVIIFIVLGVLVYGSIYYLADQLGFISPILHIIIGFIIIFIPLIIMALSEDYFDNKFKNRKKIKEFIFGLFYGILVIIFLIALQSLFNKDEDISYKSKIDKGSIISVIDDPLNDPNIIPIYSESSWSNDGQKIVYTKYADDITFTYEEEISQNPIFANVSDNLNSLRLKNLYSNTNEILLQSGTNLVIDSIPNRIIMDMETPVFSLDDQFIYFLAWTPWLNSHAIFSINLASKEIKYLTKGDSLEIIQDGVYKGNLAIQRDEINNYYILDPNSGEIKKLDD